MSKEIKTGEYVMTEDEYLFEQEFEVVEKRAAYRKQVISEFRKKTYESYHQIEGLEPRALELAVWNAAEYEIERKNLKVEIVQVLLVGSRARGIEHDKSDMDFVLEYRGDVKEDVLFNLINSKSARINDIDIPIDINPIRPEETGTLETYLPAAEKYLEEKALQIKKEIIKQNFIKEFEAWDRKDFRKTFIVSTTSDAMRMIGIDDKDITLDAVKLNRIFKHHPSMNDEIIKQLPDLINDPVFILASKQKESRIIATGEVFDADNNSVVVIMELHPKGKNDVELDEIKIASAYGKENIQNLIATSNMLYITDDKEKINRWIKCTGLQLPFGSSTIDYSYIVSQNDEKATEFKDKDLEIVLEKSHDMVNSHTEIYSKVILQERGRDMGKQNPISLWVGNQRAYTEGNSVGEWIDLPMEDSKLKEVLSNISNGFKDEIYIADSSFRDDCSYLYDVISEYEKVQDINVVAKLIGNESHPAVEMYLKYDENLTMEQIANLFLKEDKISYYAYSFDGVDNPNGLNSLSDEEKLGYTMIESDPQLKQALEKLEVDGTSIMNYVNVEAIGKDLLLSGYVKAGNEGYLDTRYLSLDLEEYTIDEINQELEQEHRESPSIEKSRTQELQQKEKKLSEPTPKGPKM